VSYRDLALRSLDQLPPFSPVLNLLMTSLADEDVSFAKLASLIERDTVLSGHVMRLVNSALYGRRGTVSSVRGALSILGINKLRNFIMGLSVSRLWAKLALSSPWDTARFNDHSVSTGILADLLVQRTTVDYPEGAFVAGLLHDLGRMMIAVALPDECARIQEIRKRTGNDLENCEQELLEVTHSELSAAALSRWGLPAPIQKAVLYHHKSHLDPTAGISGPPPLSSAVSVANEIAIGAGHAVEDLDLKFGCSPEEGLLKLGLRDNGEELMNAFQTELKAVQATI
jgi:HD-like signal output (HDOD) protein